MKVWR